MWNVKLKPEIKKKLKNPERFVSGLNIVYTGLLVAMGGVGIMLMLFIQKPDDVLKPAWIIILGLAIVAWGEWQKYRSR